MAAKCLLVLVLAVLLFQGQSASEVWLEDQYTTHQSNPHHPKTISIGKSLQDTLLSCHVIYPNGVVYEAYPSNNLLHDEINFEPAVEPFLSCAISFRDAPPSYSGTYQLLSVVSHEDNTQSLTRQRFHLTFTVSDTWVVPSSNK